MMTTHTKYVKDTVQLIHGPSGKLEVAVGKAAGKARHAWGIICHPHPLHGGTMHNKVVTTLAKAFQALGVATVRFNFRGVMQSEGRYDKGEGEVEDLLAVIDWAQQEQGKNEIWLAGFSFGAYIAAKTAAQLPVDRLVTVAPPVKNFPMQNIPPITCPWVLVQGEKDEIVPAEDVLAWAASRKPEPVVIRFPQAGHFFHGQLAALRAQVEAALR